MLSRIPAMVAYAVGLIIAVPLLMLAGVTFFVWGPVYDGDFNPVVAVAPIENVTHDKNHVCFGLPTKKLRLGTPLQYTFQIQTPLGAVIPVSVYPTDDAYKPVREVLITHPVGAHWTRYFCFLVPATISEVQGFVVTGQALHSVPHKLWNVPTTLPSFYVAPLVSP